jgi:hypothetical protein
MKEPQASEETNAADASMTAMAYLAAASSAVASSQEELIGALIKSVEYGGADGYYLGPVLLRQWTRSRASS